MTRLWWIQRVEESQKLTNHILLSLKTSLQPTYNNLPTLLIPEVLCCLYAAAIMLFSGGVHDRLWLRLGWVNNSPAMRLLCSPGCDWLMTYGAIPPLPPKWQDCGWPAAGWLYWGSILIGGLPCEPTRLWPNRFRGAGFAVMQIK